MHICNDSDWLSSSHSKFITMIILTFTSPYLIDGISALHPAYLAVPVYPRSSESSPIVGTLSLSSSFPADSSLANATKYVGRPRMNYRHSVFVKGVDGNPHLHPHNHHSTMRHYHSPQSANFWEVTSAKMDAVQPGKAWWSAVFPGEAYVGKDRCLHQIGRIASLTSSCCHERERHRAIPRKTVN